MNLTPFKIFRRFPEKYAAIGLRSDLSNAKIGPCILLYDLEQWDAWDAPYWLDDGRGGHYAPARAGWNEPCRLCGQPVSCSQHGPGEIAVAAGTEAAALIEALLVADEERVIAAEWTTFALTCDTFDVQEYRGLAEHISGESFRGFLRLPSYVMDWRDGASMGRGRDEARDISFSRDRHLPVILALLASMGIAVPAPDAPIEYPAVSAREGAAILMRRTEDDRAALTDEIMRRHAATAQKIKAIAPDPRSPTAQEELAEALMGYDHFAGEARPWGPFGRSMLGHNNPPQL